tara:strand:- start:629 stop:1153 length:525 start_codon:yes stop_codon:yes gene_type:complete
MKSSVCTSFDAYMRKMTHVDIVMTWKAHMQDGTVVWGDYERPEHDKCWKRFKSHCEKNKIVPTKISLYMFGMPEYVFFEDPNGLDGFSIMRGIGKEQRMGDGKGESFQFLSVSLLRDECDYVEVRKFVWPETNLEPNKETRLLAKKSIEQMIFKDESKKIKHPEVQKHLHGATV